MNSNRVYSNRIIFTCSFVCIAVKFDRVVQFVSRPLSMMISFWTIPFISPHHSIELKKKRSNFLLWTSVRRQRWRFSKLHLSRMWYISMKINSQLSVFLSSTLISILLRSALTSMPLLRFTLYLFLSIFIRLFSCFFSFN